MSKVLGSVEVLLAIALTGAALFPLSGLCSGRSMGLDCESRAIIAINALAPLALVFGVCGFWLWRSRSWASQYVLLSGIAAVAIYWFSHAP